MRARASPIVMNTRSPISQTSDIQDLFRGRGFHARLCLSPMWRIPPSRLADIS
jgi:hypothetical protein